jgi:hypothetical protein
MQSIKDMLNYPQTHATDGISSSAALMSQRQKVDTTSFRTLLDQQPKNLRSGWNGKGDTSMRSMANSISAIAHVPDDGFDKQDQ